MSSCIPTVGLNFIGEKEGPRFHNLVTPGGGVGTLAVLSYGACRSARNKCFFLWIVPIIMVGFWLTVMTSYDQTYQALPQMIRSYSFSIVVSDLHTIVFLL